MKLIVSYEWLKKRILKDPDIENDAGNSSIERIINSTNESLVKQPKD